MGDPKKQRKKYQTPSHPWQGARIEEERVILMEYGLKNKKELWKMSSMLRDFADRAKHLVAAKGKQADTEKKQLIAKLQMVGLVKESASLDDVMALELRNLLDRRLQTKVYMKNLARTIKQARQFITHGHIKVGDNAITTPSYIVTVDDEPLIKFSEVSSLSDLEHPERAILPKKEKKKEEPKDDRRGNRKFDKKRYQKKQQGKQATRGPKKEDKKVEKKEKAEGGKNG